MDVFLIEDDDLCNTNTTWDKVSAEIKKNVIVPLSVLNNF